MIVKINSERLPHTFNPFLVRASAGVVTMINNFYIREMYLKVLIVDCCQNTVFSAHQDKSRIGSDFNG
jgi:hypothetical protein